MNEARKITAQQCQNKGRASRKPEIQNLQRGTWRTETELKPTSEEASLMTGDSESSNDGSLLGRPRCLRMFLLLRGEEGEPSFSSSQKSKGRILSPAPFFRRDIPFP